MRPIVISALLRSLRHRLLLPAGLAAAVGFATLSPALPIPDTHTSTAEREVTPGKRKDQVVEVYEKVKASGFYNQFPDRETPIKELTNKEPTENSRGIRFGNMVQIRDIVSEELENALAGKKSPQQALDDGVSRGNTVLRQFERTAGK